MIASRFETLIRALTDRPIARRALTRGLAGAAMAAGLARWSGEDLHARKRRKRKTRNKPLENAFGCRNVGVVCTSANQCCSGLCAGKRGKKGKSSKKTCRAHDASDCRIDQDSCSGTNFACITSTGEEGFCHVTTGNASYCANDGIEFPCTKDEECNPFCGPLAACNVCNIPGEAPEQFCGGSSGCAQI
ncbi:MAG: hypothetical protein ACRDJC_04695 [Thermomicrobiales bacterium]